MNKKILILIISILMVLIVPIILYGYNFNSIVFDENFYKKEFSKNNVYGNLNGYNIEKINIGVLNYLKYEKSDQLIKNNFFNEREKIHLLDVKNLIQKSLIIFYISIILFLLLFIVLIFLLGLNFKIIVKKFLMILFFGSILALIDAFLFFIISNLNFNFIFGLFHKTFFAIGTYTFNPAFEKIVVLYPENLFFDALVEIIIGTILSSAMILLVSSAILFYFFKYKFSNFFLIIFRR